MECLICYCFSLTISKEQKTLYWLYWLSLVVMYTKLYNHFSFVKLTSWGSKIAQRKLSRTMFGCFFQKICSRLVVLRVKIHFSPLKFCNTRFKGEGRESKKLMIKKLMKKLVQLIYLFSCIMSEICPFEYQKQYSLSWFQNKKITLKLY